MLDHALATLETAVADPDWQAQSADVWEALRTVCAAGASGGAARIFWDQCGQAVGPLGWQRMAAYNALTAMVNRMCRELRIERTYARLED